MIERFTANKTVTLQFLEETIILTGVCDTCNGRPYHQARLHRHFQDLIAGFAREQTSWSNHCSTTHGKDPDQHTRTHHHICTTCGTRWDCGLPARRCRNRGREVDLCETCR